MHRRITVLVAVLALGLAGAKVAPADAPPVFPTSVFNCFGDNNIGVPSGSDLVVRIGWIANTKGLVRDYLNALSMDVKVGGVPVANPMQYWSAPFYVDGFGWLSRWSYDVGVITPANPTTFDFSMTLGHKVIDGQVLAGDDSHKPFFYDGPQVAISGCTIGAF